MMSKPHVDFLREALPALPDGFPSSSYAEAVAVMPCNIKGYAYGVDLKRDWCVGLVPHGGYVAAILITAAKQYAIHQHPELNQPDLITIHIEYLSRTVVGPAYIAISLLKPGRQFSTLRVQLFQNLSSDDSKEPSLSIEALLRIGNLAQEEASKGLSLPTRPLIKPADIPKRETCVEIQDEPILFERRPGLWKIITLLPPGSGPTGAHPVFGPSVREQWVRWRDDADAEKGFDIASLAYIADAFMPFLQAYGIYGHWYPTINMGIELKKAPSNGWWKWVFCRIELSVVKDGRYDVQVWMFDEGGEVIALCRHAVLIVDVARNLKAKGDLKL